MEYLAQRREDSKLFPEPGIAGKHRPDHCRTGFSIMRLSAVLVIGLVTLLSGWSFAQQGALQGKGPKALTVRKKIDQGREHLEKRRYAAALRVLSAAILADPSAAEAFLVRATVYEQLGSPQRALRDFTRYIELRPSDPAGYIKRGDSHFFNQNYESALADYNSAVKAAPKSTQAYIGRGLAQAALERYGEAIKDYQWALALSPDNSEVLANMGVACMMAGRSLEAATYFERALRLEKDPQWRRKIEKWIDELVRTADRGEKARGGPVRGPDKPLGPLW